jgi:protein-tyrosine phosphatase
MHTPDRHVPLAGASNFRDFGGYPTQAGGAVRWGRLWRSDRLSELTAADHSRLAPLGIRHVYDLRRPSEVAAAPTNWAGPGAPVLLHRPLFLDETGPSVFHRIAENEAARHDAGLSRQIMAQLYARLVSEAGALAIYREMFAHLAEPEAAPAPFHGSAGKDRTGVTCALIPMHSFGGGAAGARARGAGRAGQGAGGAGGVIRSPPP